MINLILGPEMAKANPLLKQKTKKKPLLGWLEFGVPTNHFLEVEKTTCFSSLIILVFSSLLGVICLLASYELTRTLPLKHTQ